MIRMALWKYAVLPARVGQAPLAEPPGAGDRTPPGGPSRSRRAAARRTAARARAREQPARAVGAADQALGGARGVMNSLMSKRDHAGPASRRAARRARGPSSVLPTPVGPTKRNAASGLSGGESPAFTTAIVSARRGAAQPPPAPTSPPRSRATRSTRSGDRRAAGTPAASPCASRPAAWRSPRPSVTGSPARSGLPLLVHGAQVLVEADGLARERAVRQVALREIDQRRQRIARDRGAVRLDAAVALARAPSAFRVSAAESGSTPDAAQAREERPVPPLERVEPVVPELAQDAHPPLVEVGPHRAGQVHVASRRRARPGGRRGSSK